MRRNPQPDGTFAKSVWMCGRRIVKRSFRSRLRRVTQWSGGCSQHKKNVLVEGMSDYLYLHALNLHCHALGRQGLPDDVYITPCGGTKLVGHIASLFLGHDVRPVVLLDGDDAGRARRDALMKELYAGYERAILMLDDVLGEEECETEDVIGEATILPVLRDLVEKRATLNQHDRGRGSLGGPDQERGGEAHG